METTTPGFNENLNTKCSNQILGEEIRASLVKSRLSCAVAFTITEKLGVAPRMVGKLTVMHQVPGGGDDLMIHYLF